MILKQFSPLTKVENQMELPLTEEEFMTLYDKWRTEPMYIQEAFPMLSAEQREFVLTGIHPDEWETYLGKEEI